MCVSGVATYKLRMKAAPNLPTESEPALPAPCLIRDFARGDYPAILALNAAVEHFTSPMDEGRLSYLHEQAAYGRALTCNSSVVAFLLAFRERSLYDSPNFVWFAERYPQFLYIDRIAVSAKYQGKRFGTALYHDLFCFAAACGISRVVCEFDLQPSNEASRRFHASFGFCEVGTQWLPDREKLVSLQEVLLTK